MLEQESTPAEREWEKLTDEITPKLVRFKEQTPAERKNETFASELARIGAYVRKFEKSEPDLAASARIFMATEILKGALERDREAVQMLREVAQTAGNGSVAGLAALRAGQLLLALGDEAALQELRDLYAGRADKDELFLHGLDGLCRKVRLQPGRLFPDLKLVDRSGQPFSLATCRGKLLLFLVFNVEHQASKAQLERVATLAQEPRADLAVVGLSVDEKAELVAGELERLKIAFPVDGQGKGWATPAAKELGLDAIPALFLIDPKGRILVARFGAVGAELPALVDAQLVRLRQEGLLPSGGK